MCFFKIMCVYFETSHWWGSCGSSQSAAGKRHRFLHCPSVIREPCPRCCVDLFLSLFPSASRSDNATAVKIACYILIGVGTFSMLLGFVGCLGTIYEIRCLLGLVGAHPQRTSAANPRRRHDASGQSRPTRTRTTGGGCFLKRLLCLVGTIFSGGFVHICHSGPAAVGAASKGSEHGNFINSVSFSTSNSC